LTQYIQHFKNDAIRLSDNDAKKLSDKVPTKLSNKEATTFSTKEQHFSFLLTMNQKNSNKDATNLSYKM